MPKLSLSDVVDVISKSGTPKATKVSQIKNRPAYSPQTDFYKALREGIADVHEKGKSKAALKEILSFLTDQKKLSNYPDAVKGYTKWWGKKELVWNSTFSEVYGFQGVDVGVNPELGLLVDGVPHLIKLYFKDEPLQKLRVDVVTALMETSLGPHAEPDCAMGVLDVRRSRLHVGSGDQTIREKLMKMVDAELSYIAVLWAAD